MRISSNSFFQNLFKNRHKIDGKSIGNRWKSIKKARRKQTTQKTREKELQDPPKTLPGLPQDPPRPPKVAQGPPGTFKNLKKGSGSRWFPTLELQACPQSPPRDNLGWFLVDFRRFLMILQHLPRDIAIFLVWAGLRPPQNGPSKSFTPKRERPKNTVFLTSAQKVNFPTISVGFKNRVRHGPHRVWQNF